MWCNYIILSALLLCFCDSEIVDCTGIMKEKLFVLLFNKAKSPFGSMTYIMSSDKTMEIIEAQEILKDNNYVDYVHGKPMKINFGTWPLIESWGYDRDQGGSDTMKNWVKELLTSGTNSNENSSDEILEESYSEFEDCVHVPNIDGLKHFDENYNLIPTSGLKQYDFVTFYPSTVKKLKERKVPYPDSWCMYLWTDWNGNLFFLGPVGNKFHVHKNELCIKTLEYNFD